MPMSMIAISPLNKT